MMKRENMYELAEAAKALEEIEKKVKDTYDTPKGFFPSFHHPSAMIANVLLSELDITNNASKTALFLDVFWKLALHGVAVTKDYQNETIHFNNMKDLIDFFLPYETYEDYED